MLFKVSIEDVVSAFTVVFLFIQEVKDDLNLMRIISSVSICVFIKVQPIFLNYLLKSVELLMADAFIGTGDGVE
jgi:hypothetical protein